MIPQGAFNLSIKRLLASLAPVFPDDGVLPTACPTEVPVKNPSSMQATLPATSSTPDGTLASRRI